MATARKRAGALGLALLFVLSVVAPAAAAGEGNTAINYGSDHADDVWIEEDQATIAVHDRAEFDSGLNYWDDSGERAMLPAELNESKNNTYEFRADALDDDDLRSFPRANDSDRTVDADEWTKDASGTAGSLTVTNVTPHDGVEAVEISTSSQSSGDRATFTYALDEHLDDPAKRTIFVIANVDTLDTDAVVDIEAVDADGDYKEAEINGSQDSDRVDVVANGTAEGVLYQSKLSDLSTNTTAGDGSFDEVAEVRVNISDADAAVQFTSLDVGRKTNVSIATKTMDDGDTETIEQNADGGWIATDSLDTLPAMLDDARINDLRVKGIQYGIEDVESGDVSAQYPSADAYPNFNAKLDYYARIKVPAPIDVTHSGLELRAEQGLVTERYNAYEYAEGVGDTEFSDISSSSWTDETDNLEGDEEEITLDDTISTGEEIAIHFKPLLLEDEESDLKKTGTGGGGGFWGGSGGGPLGTLVNTVAAGATFLAGLLGIRRYFGG
jgi:hypothetical protein